MGDVYDSFSKSQTSLLTDKKTNHKLKSLCVNETVAEKSYSVGASTNCFTAWFWSSFC